MTSIPKRNDLAARLERLERAVRDLSRSNVIPLPGPPGPPGPIEGTTIEASVEMSAPLATFDELDVTGDATVGGTLAADIVEATTVEAATATISTELTAPLVTAGRVVYTDRTFSRVAMPAPFWDTTTAAPTLADIPGMTFTVDVDSTADTYLVSVCLDVGSLGTSVFTAALMVNGVQQTSELHFAVNAASGFRQSISQTYLITGLAAGNRIFKVRAGSATIGHHRINHTHSTMTIVQQQ